jgi:hypothetical protein
MMEGGMKFIHGQPLKTARPQKIEDSLVNWAKENRGKRKEQGKIPKLGEGKSFKGKATGKESG